MSAVGSTVRYSVEDSHMLTLLPVVRPAVAASGLPSAPILISPSASASMEPSVPPWMVTGPRASSAPLSTSMNPWFVRWFGEPAEVLRERVPPFRTTRLPDTESLVRLRVMEAPGTMSNRAPEATRLALSLTTT